MTCNCKHINGNCNHEKWLQPNHFLNYDIWYLYETMNTNLGKLTLVTYTVLGGLLIRNAINDYTQS